MNCIDCKQAIHGPLKFGYHCGCVFHLLCIDDKITTCPVHRLPLRSVGQRHKCLLEPCKGDADNGVLCNKCIPIVHSKIHSIFENLSDAIDFRELFTILFSSGRGSIWPTAFETEAQSAHGRLKCCVDPATGKATKGIIDGEVTSFSHFFLCFWTRIVGIIQESPTVCLENNRLVYSPLFVYNRLKEMPLEMYTLSEILDGTATDSTPAMIQAWRAWIRTSGSGLVRLLTLEDSSVRYRLVSKHNIVSKLTLLAAVQRNSGGTPLLELYGEHPAAADWIDELEADSRIVILNKRVFERPEVSFAHATLQLVTDGGQSFLHTIETPSI